MVVMLVILLINMYIIGVIIERKSGIKLFLGYLYTRGSTLVLNLMNVEHVINSSGHQGL